MKWSDIEEVHGVYEVSEEGDIRRKSSGRVLKGRSDKDGYLEYCLCVSNKRIYRRGHRLVALSFLPNPESKPEVNHKDNVKYNNNVDNLEWVTDAENNRHYYADFHVKGKGLCTLDKQDWDDILALHKGGASYPEIAEIYQLEISRPDSIGSVLSGERLSEYTGFTSDMRNEVSTVGRKVTDRDVMDILEASHIQGVSNMELCTMYDLSPAQVSRICSGQRRKEVYRDFIKRRQ